jgi:hypothetical protein
MTQNPGELEAVADPDRGHELARDTREETPLGARPGPDLGLETVAFLRQHYQIEQAWIEERERGFRWWPAELAQEIWSEPAWDDDGIVVWRVHLRTDLLSEPVPGGRPVDWLAFAARTIGSLSAPVLEGEGGRRARLAASLYVHEQNLAWTQPLLAWVGLIQVAEARLWAQIAEETGVARAAWSGHPVAGPRPEPDELAGMVDTLVRPLGRGRSCYAGRDMEECLRLLQRPPVLLATGGPTGVTAELPFGGRTCLLRLHPDAEHPALGAGLLVLLTLPVSGVSAAQTLDLNRRELAQPARTALLGSWVPDETGPTFAAFYPNAVRQEGLAANVAIGTVLRSCWFAESLLGEGWSEGSATALDRVASRARRRAQKGGKR